MSFRESFSLPPDCALREDFPDGEVYVQTVGSESHTGPTHVDLYDKPWEEVPRVPAVHLQLDSGPNAAYVVEAALREAHEADSCFSDGDYGCIALDSLGAIAKRHRENALMAG